MISLARELGMTVSAMLNRMSSSELTEQKAYDRVMVEERDPTRKAPPTKKPVFTGDRLQRRLDRYWPPVEVA